MKGFSGMVLAVACMAIAQAADQVTQESGDWNSVAWTPGPQPGLNDLVHIEGGAAVEYTGGFSQNLNRLYVGDNSTGAASSEGTLEIKDGTLTVNANAAGAVIVGRSDGSVGTLVISGGQLQGIGNMNGAGMQIGFGLNSSGSVRITGGELNLASGIIVGYGDNSTGHFEINDGAVIVSQNVDGGDFSIGGRIPGSNTGTYVQTGGSVTVVRSQFRVGYAGATNQRISATASITGGSFIGNVLVGRQASLKVGGGGAGGELTIGAAADVSGADQAWEVSSDGRLIFLLGTTEAFNPVNLSTVTADTALVFSQPGAKVVVDGGVLKYSMLPKPITLIKFEKGKEPSEVSLRNVEFEYVGFDQRLQPELVWTDTSLQLIFKR